MKATILLVEDSAESVELTRAAFGECKVEIDVAVACNGRQALDYLSGKGAFGGRKPLRRPDLVLLDLRLPEIDGFEVLSKIRADKAMDRVPVVIMTVSRLRSDIERAYRLGANSYIVKPLDYDEYVVVLRKVCEYWFGVNERPYA